MSSWCRLAVVEQELAEILNSAYATTVLRATSLAPPCRSGASLAHPSPDCDDATFTTLRDLGMDAIEVAFPAANPKHSRNLRAIAKRLGMIVTGGSDCHGGDSASRTVGCRGLNHTEWQGLHQHIPIAPLASV